jgi:integrase
MGHRDATMILVAYRHGLRVSELVDLRFDQIDFNAGTLAVRRAKRGTPAMHPFAATNCAPCAVSSVSRIPSRRSCLRRSAGHHSLQRALRAWWSVPEKPQG